jgi:ABC-type amino acid transport substrate-binding protein
MRTSHPNRFFVDVRAAAAMLVAALPGVSVADPVLDRIRERGTIVLAHRESSVPLSYLVDGKPVGYSMDVCHKLAARIAAEVGLKSPRIEYKLVTSATRFDVIEQGLADLECGSTTNTTARRKRVSFTISHFIAASRVMVLSKHPYDRIEDLNKRRIASTAGTTNVGSLEQEAKLKGLDLKIELAKDHAEAVSWVQSGKVDGFAMDDVLLFGLRASSADSNALKIIGKPITIEPYSIGFARDNPDLKRVVDREIRRLIMSKELHAMYDRWFQQPIPPKGITLGMPMSFLLQDSLKYPSDYVP